MIELKKKTIAIIDKDGDIVEVNSDGSINVNIVSADATWDKHSNGFVLLTNTGYTEILKYVLLPDETIFIREIVLSLKGMVGDFRVIKKSVGQSDEIIREYRLNTQKPSFSELLGNPISLTGENSEYRVEARLWGVNQSGAAFVALNGYKK